MLRGVVILCDALPRYPDEKDAVVEQTAIESGIRRQHRQHCQQANVSSTSS
jgi:hypothetical protein